MFESLTEQEQATMTELLRKSGSSDKNEALASQKTFAGVLQEPLRQGITTGNIISNIFAVENLDINARPEYPIDFFRPDNAGEFVAYVCPNQGKVPQRHVEGDYVTVPTYCISSSIDFLLRYAKEARWNVVSRALEVLEASMVKKMNDDGWHTLLSAGFARNIIVSDANAAAGQFTKRLISLMKTVMRRNAGGNSTSMMRGKLTHLFISPEAMEDIRNWGVDEVDELTRREIFTADDGSYNRIFGVNLVDLDELGDNQEYQDYYETVPATGASNSGLASATDVELVVGLDLQKQNSFVMPVREKMEIFVDDNLHRENRAGYYTRAEQGFAVLDGSKILLGSI